MVAATAPTIGLILEPHAAEVLPKLIWHYNEPYADASMIPTYYVSEMTRRHVTVALNGDGGDEAFIGTHVTTRCASWPIGLRARAVGLQNCACAAFIAPARVRHNRYSSRLESLAQRLSERTVSSHARHALSIVLRTPINASAGPCRVHFSRVGARFARQVRR